MPNSVNLNLAVMSGIHVFLNNDARADDQIGVRVNLSGLGDNGHTNPGIHAGTTLRVAFSPYGFLSATEASGILETFDQEEVESSGIYFAEKNYNIYSSDNESLTAVMDKAYENSNYEAHWLLFKGDQDIPGNYQSIYGDSSPFHPNGKISFPHSPQYNEVVLSGSITSSNTILYNLKWDSILNEGSGNYGAPPEELAGPYRLAVRYLGIETDVPGWEEWVRYPAGVMATGIQFELPYQITGNVAQYKFEINNNWSDTTLPHPEGSLPLSIDLNGNTIYRIINEFRDRLPSSANLNDNTALRDTGIDIPIDAGTIPRRRAIVGVQDIGIVDNTYKKYGEYVSEQFVVDEPVYTFSLRVDEFIPEYPNISPTEAVKYYVEFDDIEFIRISPINRILEEDEQGRIPKILVFDKVPEAVESKNLNIKYISYDTGVLSFRIKIVFDISRIADSKFVSPEIKDFKAMVFNKDHLLNL